MCALFYGVLNFFRSREPADFFLLLHVLSQQAHIIERIEVDSSRLGSRNEQV